MYLIFFFILGSNLSQAADSYTLIYQDTPLTVDEHSTCKKLYNNHASTSDIYVPTKTTGEWAAFRTNLPTGVTMCSCDAQLVAESCWYYGGSNESCDDLCSSYGGYDAATATYAGSVDANCEEILDALSAPAGTLNTNADDYGCYYQDLKSERIRGTDPTVSNSSAANTFRACACQS